MIRSSKNQPSRREAPPNARRVFGARLLAVLVAVLAVAATSTSSPATASADAVVPAGSSVSGGAAVWVSTTAWVHSGGGGVTWPVAIRCPKGKTYTTTALLSERDPVAIPEMLGDDVGINARPTEDRSGRCTGRPQLLILQLVTQPVNFYYFPTDTWINGYYPIHPSTKTNAQLTLDGPGFSTLYCAAPACAEETGPRVELK